MDDRTNTIAGWILGAGIVALGATIVTGEVYKAERPEKMGYPIEGVVVDDEGGGGAEQPIEAYLASADPTKGADVFKKCTACHNAEKGGANQLGPNLWSVMGKPHGHVPGFAYSDALKSVPGTWNWDSLNQWLKSPKTYAPGTKMTFAGLSKPEDRASLIVYLNQQSDSPLPLPAAPAAAAAPEEAGAGAAKAESEPVLTEGEAAKQPEQHVGGEAAPAVSGSAAQTKH
jgi:cytochrome c